jgi:nucleoside-diphosphate-sugar epimerase
MDKRILVTGANGFVGTALVKHLESKGYPVRQVVRKNSEVALKGDVVTIETLDGKTEWAGILEGVDTVVHVAARVHVLKETSEDPLADFRKVNLEGTLNLARQAARANVRRFIFLSTIGVHGQKTQGSESFRVNSPAKPHSPYAVSKWEAENALKQLQTAMEIVIIRPPLVYGVGAPGNFGRLVKLVKMGLPLPFAAVHNQRSIVYVENLTDLIETCIHHEGAANQEFLVRDAAMPSTKELVKKMAEHLNKPSLLFPIPNFAILGVLKLLGKTSFYDQLWESLVIDDGETQQRLGWMPPVSLDAALQRILGH